MFARHGSSSGFFLTACPTHNATNAQTGFNLWCLQKQWFDLFRLDFRDGLTCFAAVNCKIVFLADQSLGQARSATHDLAGVRCQRGGGAGRGGAVGTGHFGSLGDCFHQHGGGLVEAVSPRQPSTCQRRGDGGYVTPQRFKWAGASGSVPFTRDQLRNS